MPGNLTMLTLSQAGKVENKRYLRLRYQTEILSVWSAVVRSSEDNSAV